MLYTLLKNKIKMEKKILRKNKERKIKEIEDSKIEVFRVQKEWIDEAGIKKQQGKWETLTSEINLGSCKNPNKEISFFKIHVPDKQKQIFGGLFGG